MASVKLSGFRYLILFPKTYLVDFLLHFLVSFVKENNTNYFFPAVPFFSIIHSGGRSVKERLPPTLARIFFRAFVTVGNLVLKEN